MFYNLVKRNRHDGHNLCNVLYQYQGLFMLFWILQGIRDTGASVDLSTGVKKIQSDEERLLDYLFKDYNPSARPVLNSSKTVPVNMMFSLMHMQELVSYLTFMQIEIVVDNHLYQWNAPIPVQN